ncbi:hypothetical protein SNEBB_003681 [Seison nebaliae]|nr:hypothetical protein SNEBB_003681 [Seison nebaliae]
MIDHFSKYVELYPLKRHTTDDIIRCLHSFVGTYGVPLQITTDAGSEFRSQKFDLECQRFGIIRSSGLPEHHQSIGQAERSIRTINELLRIAVGSHQEDWETVIHSIKFTLNNTISRITNFTPSQLLFRKEPNHPNPLLQSNRREKQIIEEAFRNIQSTTRKEQRRLDTQQHESLKNGEKVRIRLRKQSKMDEQSAKLCELFSEIYDVIETYENGNVKIRDEFGNTIIRHSNDLVRQPQTNRSRSGRPINRNYRTYLRL